MVGTETMIRELSMCASKRGIQRARGVSGAEDRREERERETEREREIEKEGTRLYSSRGSRSSYANDRPARSLLKYRLQKSRVTLYCRQNETETDTVNVFFFFFDYQEGNAILNKYSRCYLNVANLSRSRNALFCVEKNNNVLSGFSCQ